MELTDKIDAYINDQLSEIERIAFEDAIQSDPDLANEVELQKLLIKGIQHKGKSNIKGLIAAASNQYANENKNEIEEDIDEKIEEEN
ncbi:MAG: hypothetical protein AAGK97_03060, partial [Bacteroidota bacterium]